MLKLMYVGKGGFIAGVPARSLTEAEARKHGGLEVLVASGLYEEVPVPGSHDPHVVQVEIKALGGGAENKGKKGKR